MKTWRFGFFCTWVVMTSMPAWAQMSRAARLHELSEQLAPLEASMRRDDLDAVDRHLERLEGILRDYRQGPRGRDCRPPPGRGPAPGSAISLTCLSNGQSGSYERFAITDSVSGATFGKPTLLNTCKQLTAVQNAGLMCVSNGESGSYERFMLFDLNKRQTKGGGTDVKTCVSLIQRATPGFTCVSNGQSGSYEKFRLLNRDQDKPLGGETQLQQCLVSIPN